MALEKYNAKRRFDETPEPSGKKYTGKGPLRFVIQKHQASRLHYDFRLEMDGVLKSWAVPKGPSLDPHERRLAMMTEDHPWDYRTFEGIIPEGNYGAGTVMVWDEGTFAPWAETSKKKWEEVKDRKKGEKILLKMLADGHLTFVMHGTKLHGEFALIKMHDAKDEGAWLLIKKGDEFADEKRDITKEDKSAVTNRSLTQIAKAADKEWGDEEIDLSNAPKAKMLHDVSPMLATLTDGPFDRDGWIFEIKWDGYRAIAEVGRGVKLYSRNGQAFNEKFSPVAKALEDFGHDAVLDGEVVAVDNDGRSKFQLLQGYQKTDEGTLVYYIFDILHLDGHDLTDLPLVRRKEILKQVIKESPVIQLSEHIEGDGKAFFVLAKKQGLEGIVAKDGGGSYLVGKRSQGWLKIKSHMRQEVVVGGWTDPKGGRKGVGSLLLGVYDGKDLIYSGNSGGAFGGLTSSQMFELVSKLEVKKSPFSNPPKGADIHWCKPHLVCEVEFTEWTSDGSMRHPNVVGWRTDKDAKKVVREVPSVTPSEAEGPLRNSDDEDNQRSLQQGRDDKKKSGKEEEHIKIGDHDLKITHRSKVYWPEDKITKGQLVDYYREVAPLILPYLKDRPENMNRHPNGINGPSFYHKDFEEGPSWLKTKAIYSESNEKDIHYLVCNDEATLVYMANLGCIEINPWNSRINKIDNPDYMIIDLDPEDISFEEVINTAQAVHEVLDKAGVESYPKTSGATGLHIYVPLGAKYDYEQCKNFAHLVGMLVNQKLPDITSLERSPSKRQKRVYLDYLQNRHGQTLASAYSVRPKPGATVSTPLKWEEVKKGLDPQDFTIFNTMKRIDKVGDLFKPVLGKGTDLKKCLAKLEQEG